MITTADVLAAMHKALPAKRRQVDHVSLFNALTRRVPALIGADDRWTLFVDALRQADAAGVVVLPAKSGKGWLRYTDPILPAWIKLPPEVAQADSFDHRSFGWCRQLTFLAKERLLKRSVRNSALDIQRFFAHEGEWRPIVPVKERSYSIFGDEKKLDEIAETATLFGPGRLTLAELRCQVVEPTPVTARFAGGTGILVVENEATFDSFCRLCRHRDTFAMVVYGRGNEILKCTAFLRKTAAELGALSIHYFGDVDRRGLSIAGELTTLLAPALQLLPHQPGYEFILTEIDADPAAEAGNYAWLGLELAQKAASVVARQSAVPQERFGWEQICSVYAIDPSKS
jgi:hypothetical protein